MKKLISLICFLCLLVSCQSSSSNGIDNLPEDLDTTESKILIAYFTWADNTIVADPDSVNPDASTSASVLAPGNSAIVASFINEAVGGDLFSIIVDEPYPSDYNECLDRASNEKALNARPNIVNKIDNMNEYDIIFIGYPNWWYSVPMAILSFVESYDLSNKTIIPFCTHGTGGLASSVRDLEEALPEDINFINNAFGVYRPNTTSCQNEVNDWLRELGFKIN